MNQSHSLYTRAQAVIPGGVNSPVRAFRGVGGEPLFLSRAHGAYIYDADGRRYIDYVASWGPAILGHAHPEVVTAVQTTAARGLSFGAPCELEVLLAERVRSLMPSLEQIRMVSSGTEATMSALRLARGYTGRNKILKFEGCYHGHADSLLVKAGSGALTLGIPSSAGVTPGVAQDTLTVAYNDLAATEACFAQYSHELAAVIVEPVAGNMNCVLPAPGFLEGLRRLCDASGTVLIFDEVMTGFRVALGGAQARFGITPDLTTLGKVIGGGLPVGAFGGKAAIMAQLAPIGPVYQAGTLSGNPVAMAAGLKTLELIAAPDFFEHLEAKTQILAEGLQQAAQDAGIPFTTVAIGGMFGLFFTTAPQVTRFAEVMACDVPRFQRFFHAMLASGVYLAPSAFEAGFVSSAHTATDLEETCLTAARAFKSL